MFGIDPSLPPMDIARKAIAALADFFFKDLGLKSTLPEVGIDETHFEIMAGKSVNFDTLPGFKPLKQKDVVEIYKMCMK